MGFGRFFGTNLSGVNVAELFDALAENPALSFPDFVKGLPPGYRVALPAERPLDLVARYPWLFEGERPAQPGAGSWEVTLTREGVPVRVAWTAQAVTQPVVRWVSPEIRAQRLSTNRVLVPTAAGYELTASGRRFLALLATTAEGSPSW